MLSRLDYKLVNIYDRALFDRESACSVCIVPFLAKNEEPNMTVQKTTKRYVKQLLCGHSFHVNCINTWFAHHNHTCPVCRRLVFSSCAFHNISESESETESTESGTETESETESVIREGAAHRLVHLLWTHPVLTVSDDEYLST